MNNGSNQPGTIQPIRALVHIWLANSLLVHFPLRKLIGLVTRPSDRFYRYISHPFCLHFFSFSVFEKCICFGFDFLESIKGVCSKKCTEVENTLADAMCNLYRCLFVLCTFKMTLSLKVLRKLNN